MVLARSTAAPDHSRILGPTRETRSDLSARWPIGYRDWSGREAREDDTVKVEVRNISTNDGQDLEKVMLEDPGDVDVWVTVLAGPADDAGEEAFQLRVRSPASMAKELDRWGPLHERHMVVVASWDPHQIRSFIHRLFTDVEGRDWHEVSNKLSRVGFWEFEDYRA
jgi:hypothetical protein